jgi:hypothetical protein
LLVHTNKTRIALSMTSYNWLATPKPEGARRNARWQIK